MLIPLFVALFMTTSSYAQLADCGHSIYKYRDESLCFSMKYKSYLTQDCGKGKCQAFAYLDNSITFDKSKLPKGETAHAGSKMCEALGGKVEIVTSEKTKDQLCLCAAPDFSGISCSKLGLR